jgi:hypothetical protein
MRHHGHWRGPAFDATEFDSLAGGFDMTSEDTTPQEPGKAGQDPSVPWSRIKEILDGAINGWKVQHNGREPKLTLRHGASFGWDTKDKLANATAQGFRLIDPSMVGNGQGAQTNLVIALRDEDGVEGFGQMPNGGPFLPTDQINEIVRWIDADMPD